ncbi:hypothetical protein DEO72_LG4g958 [Vigna unguiculata]|uniref:Uncharacterized protein n=1 Tax=Vigna unguiculata TaxID=3917 RepID=A0A4D6LP89_VIGUN|nr:hypothetical protein DEO72_LG4g958 [Vigna unguiculata]
MYREILTPLERLLSYSLLGFVSSPLSSLLELFPTPPYSLICCVRVYHRGLALAHSRKTVARSDNLAQRDEQRLTQTFYARGRSSNQLNFERASVSLKRGESRLSENAQRPLLCWYPPQVQASAESDQVICNPDESSRVLVY